MDYPEWVLRHKTVGKEIKRINGNYYLYERKSKWDPVRKKAKKVSGKYLGRITENGLLPPRQFVSLQNDLPVSVKEYGAYAYLTRISDDIIALLEKHFPDIAAQVYVISLLRLVGKAPLKRLDNLYERSWLSEMYGRLPMSAASITSLLDKLGGRREQIVSFMKELCSESSFILIDGTKITSLSQDNSWAQIGSNRKHDYSPQINLMYLFGINGTPSPAFYRCLPGNIADVSAISLTIAEYGCKDVTIVADNGFASAENFALLDENNLKYIVPLRRNTTEVDRNALCRRECFSDAFTYNKRAITAYTEKKDDYNVFVFRDEKLRSDEMVDFIARKKKRNLAIESCKKAKDFALSDIGTETAEQDALFGTMFIRTNCVKMSAKQIYETYKLRAGIEQSFDVLKNTLDSDSSYMHDEQGFEAWCFLNHISLVLSFRILECIKRKNLTSTYSLDDLLSYLSGIKKVRISNEWKLAEYNKKTAKMCELLSIELT